MQKKDYTQPEIRPELIDHFMKHIENRISFEKNRRYSERVGVPTYILKSLDYHCGYRISENGFEPFANDKTIRYILELTENWFLKNMKISDVEEVYSIQFLSLVLSVFIDVMDGILVNTADQLSPEKNIQITYYE